ncbi:MAG TPA: 6-phosphogluconolactonase [Candidatus Methylomirabilis sp.]|nr:6-phosphogluconolactonase [Candidatus Methylomirabilis sp.]
MSDPHSKTEVRILPDGAAIAKRAAQRFVEIAAAAVRKNGCFRVALSGGSTPKTLYSLLVTDPALRAQMPWDKAFLFFGDERHVPPDDPQSNFRMATEAMISKSPLKADQVFRIKGEYPEAEQAALEYEKDIRTHFHLSDGQFPRFDLVLLGMGNEGHVASLFPGTKALQENRRIVVHNWVGKVLMDRITLTAPAINNAEHIIAMVTGNEKALALTAVLERVYEPEQLPAQLIRPVNGDLLWLVDTAASSMLTRAIRE